MKRTLLTILLLTLLLTACTDRSAGAPSTAEKPVSAAETAPESTAATQVPTPIVPSAVPAGRAVGSLRVNGSATVLSLELPEGWLWESVDGVHPGLALWPEPGEDFRVSVTCWPEGFAQCGTGVSEREVHVGESIPAVLMTEDIGGTMTWTLLLRTEDAYVLSCTAGGARFETYGGGLNELLASLRLLKK